MVSQALMTSTHSEWYTPPWLLERVAAFLGTDYLDPCPASQGKPASDGLMGLWQGRVYCNPPYGRSIGMWTRKALTDPIEEAILLVPARTDTRWFQPLLSHTVCFVRGRLHFSGSDTGAPFPSALVYIGPRPDVFTRAFADLGPITQRRLARPDAPGRE